LHSKQQKTYQGDAKDARTHSYRVTDQPWSFQGPYRVPKTDIKIFENFGASFRLCSPFPHYTLYSPTNHIGTLSWSLRNSTNAQGTLLDPPMDPKMGPARLISGDTWYKRALQGPFTPQNYHFLKRSLDNGQTFYSLV